jgi:hypothetical protein
MRQHIERNESSSKKRMRGERKKKKSAILPYSLRSAIIAYTVSEIDPFLGPIQRKPPSFTLISRKGS